MSDSALSGLLSTVFGVQANSIGIGGLLAILSINPILGNLCDYYGC